MSLGSFSGNPITRWLVDSNGKDRDMELLEDFSYTDPDGNVWPAPKGSVINGASIPEALWSTVGSPYTDDYRRASVVHDVACGTPGIERKAADRMFRSACLAGGCGRMQANILYAGVRIGAWSNANLPAEALENELFVIKTTADFSGAPDHAYLNNKLSAIAADMAKLPATANIADLDRLIEKHLVIPEGEAVTLNDGIAPPVAGGSLKATATRAISVRKRAAGVRKAASKRGAG